MPERKLSFPHKHALPNERISLFLRHKHRSSNELVIFWSFRVQFTIFGRNPPAASESLKVILGRPWSGGKLVSVPFSCFLLLVSCNALFFLFATYGLYMRQKLPLAKIQPCTSCIILQISIRFLHVAVLPVCYLLHGKYIIYIASDIAFHLGIF